MKIKKKKIFLAAFLNYPNAQNINCLSLAKHLDYSKFTVYSLSTYFSQNINTKAILFKCYYPFKLTSFIGYLWGFILCDIIYFPKHRSIPNWIIRFANFHGKKVFTTIENNMCDLNKESILNSFGGRENLVNYFKNIPNIFGITKYIINNSNCGVKLKNKVLYLGVEKDDFIKRKKRILRNIVFVGSLKKRKRVEEFIKLAKYFPLINFSIIGEGVNNKILRNKATSNVAFFGLLSQNELSYRFSNMDLLFLPSKSEGFPKVILEAAASGIPSLVYSDYGASEWIESFKNGFIVNNFNDIIVVIKRLIEEKDLLEINSDGAMLIANKFDWKVVIKDWEMTILNL